MAKGGLLSAIKKDVERTGQNKGKLFYVKTGTKARVRFLDDMDNGHIIKIHDRWEPQLSALCKKNFDEDAECQYCEMEGVRLRDFYCWHIWDYENSEIKLFIYPANNCSPVPMLVAMFENYGTITDRDYSVGRSGTGTNTTYSVIPLDKSKFRNEKAKPYSEKEFWKIIKGAYSDSENEDTEDDEEDEKPTKVKSKKADDWDDEESPAKVSYEDMTAKELYNLCLDRDIDTESRLTCESYIKLLKKADAKVKQDSPPWDDEAKDDYSKMSAKELFELCKQRRIPVEARKEPKYYIVKLDKYDEENSDDEDDDFWGED